MWPAGAAFYAAVLCGIWLAADDPKPYPDTRETVDRAQAIAVVRAPEEYTGEAVPPNSSAAGWLHFEVTELLRGDLEATVSIPGTLVDYDDFNEAGVPYPESRGSDACYAYRYRRGGTYLLLLRRVGTSWSPYWQAIRPTNEQLLSGYEGDPWYRWVRDRTRSDPALGRLEPHAGPG